MFDKDQLRLEILLAEHERMYRVGGRAPANWIVNLVAVVCGLAPILLLVPFAWAALPRVRFVPFEPIIIDGGIGISVALAYLVTRRWAAPIQRRRAVVVALLTAAALHTVIFAIAGIDFDQTSWLFFHIGNTLSVVVAVIIALRAGSTSPPSAGYRRSASSLADRADRDHQPGAKGELYISSPWFARN